MTVGERVRIVRKELKMTQAEFGERIGLGLAAISLIEKGNVTERNIRNICSAYGIRRSWLVDGVGEMHEATESIEELSLSFTELLSEYPAILALAKLASKHMTVDDWKHINEILGKVVD